MLSKPLWFILEHSGSFVLNPCRWGYYVLKIHSFKYNLCEEYDLKTHKLNFLVKLTLSKCFILLLTYIKWKQIARYFSCLFKIRHFSCSKDRCPDICLTWWPRGSETQDGYDSVCMLNGKRTEQNKIMKHLLWFSATLNTLNASQFTEFWNVVGIKTRDYLYAQHSCMNH